MLGRSWLKWNGWMGMANKEIWKLSNWATEEETDLGRDGTLQTFLQTTLLGTLCSPTNYSNESHSVQSQCSQLGQQNKPRWITVT